MSDSSEHRKYDGPERRAGYPFSICERHDTKINRLHEAIYGNGDPKKGLIWMNEKHTEALADIQGYVNSIKGITWRVITFMVIAGLSALGTFGLQIYNFMIKAH